MTLNPDQKTIKVKEQVYFCKKNTSASGLPTELSTAFVGKYFICIKNNKIRYFGYV